MRIPKCSMRSHRHSRSITHKLIELGYNEAEFPAQAHGSPLWTRWETLVRQPRELTSRGMAALFPP